ncbi:MAG TPA: PilZ domain-containing protein [Syntrophorhabdaceae bacterium]|nr:PilZ domain-containing protein [Syntrophorhabdaceae bacterium]HOL05657.1 PilZ domain-containing protein [Syntrophorhabdaceae bacterium]HON85549.1 PilZ domain-containing protein [Syntrophorhabdaceae bacterium]HPP41877.1 PilZ domain-containing protein [Syntrophorhabdaceae bacterium]HQE81222.1 PilZ domain-containing protein [Syntrophorhabdaceae bacterium]
METWGYIRPGLIIKLIVDTEGINKTSEMRGSIVYDVSEKEIIVSQIDPPILEDRLNQTAIITFLKREKNHRIRYRFHAKIIGLIKNYRLSSTETVHAIKLLRSSKPEPYNMRKSYRVELPNDSGIELFIYGIKTNIIDISLGGASISHNRTYNFDEGMVIKVTLMIDREVFEVDALIVRKWLPQDTRFHDILEFMALEFLSVGVKLQNILARKAIDIQRALNYKELFSA